MHSTIIRCQVPMPAALFIQELEFQQTKNWSQQILVGKRNSSKLPNHKHCRPSGINEQLSIYKYNYHTIDFYNVAQDTNLVLIERLHKALGHNPVCFKSGNCPTMKLMLNQDRFTFFVLLLSAGARVS
jgi:hypothetical protein